MRRLEETNNNNSSSSRRFASCKECACFHPAPGEKRPRRVSDGGLGLTGRRRAGAKGSKPSDMPAMAPNSSAFCFPNASVQPHFFQCFDFNVSFYMFVGFAFANLLLCPLYVTVIWTGFRRWTPRGSATAGATSQPDVFTYCMTVVDVVSLLGSLFFSVAVYTCSQWMKMAGYYVFSFTFPVQTLFHCLTCVERYLAVVYPVTYRGLRLMGGGKIRNVSVTCVLLLCVASLGLTTLYLPRFPTAPFFAVFGVTIFVVLFCSISALRALIRLGLGKVGGERTDQSKQRVFHTIMAITGALALRSCGLILCTVIFGLEQATGTGWCVMLMSGIWMCLPSSLVLPMLFVHKAGKLPCFCNLHKSKT